MLLPRINLALALLAFLPLVLPRRGALPPSSALKAEVESVDSTGATFLIRSQVRKPHRSAVTKQRKSATVLLPQEVQHGQSRVIRDAPVAENLVDRTLALLDDQSDFARVVQGPGGIEFLAAPHKMIDFHGGILDGPLEALPPLPLEADLSLSFFLVSHLLLKADLFLSPPSPFTPYFLIIPGGTKYPSHDLADKCTKKEEVFQFLHLICGHKNVSDLFVSLSVPKEKNFAYLLCLADDGGGVDVKSTAFVENTNLIVSKQSLGMAGGIGVSLADPENRPFVARASQPRVRACPDSLDSP